MNSPTIIDVPAAPMKHPTVEFQTDDGEDDDCEQDEETNLEKRCHGEDDGLEDHLKTFGR